MTAETYTRAKNLTWAQVKRMTRREIIREIDALEIPGEFDREGPSQTFKMRKILWDSIRAL